MTHGEYRLRWAAKVRAAAAFCLAGAVAGTALYFGNLSYVKAGDDAANAAASLVTCDSGSLQLVGSTTFAAIAQAADAYRLECPDATISISSDTDDAYGLTELNEAVQTNSGQAGSTIAMYNGLSTIGYVAGLVPYPVGVLVYSIVAHSGTFPGNNVTTGRLRGLFAGSGEPGYVAVGRLPGSASRSSLFTKVLGQVPGNPVPVSCPAPIGARVSVTSCTESSTETALYFVNQIPRSVSYAKLSTSTTAAYPGISVIRINNVAPTAANVLNGSYPYWTVEHLYTGPHPTALATDFIRFLSHYINISKAVGFIPCSAATKSLEPDCT
jgi:phosphate transport system substrate-binding protein